MGDTVSLGYQAALVTFHSPIYGRLWLANQLHPGNTISATQAEALVRAAETRTGLRPRRRTELVAARLAEAALAVATTPYDTACELHQVASDRRLETNFALAEWSREQLGLEGTYRDAWPGANANERSPAQK